MGEIVETGKRVEFANTLRGVAAVCVVISHYGGVFWLYPQTVATLTFTPVLQLQLPRYLQPLHAIPHFNWGAFGVALFFLVSGFVIPFSFARVSRMSFLVGRFFRIFPLYAVGFSITLLSVRAAAEYYGSAWDISAKEVILHYIPGIHGLFWSRSIDGIIWTLDIEMLFYVICAIVYTGIRAGSMWVMIVPVLIVANAILVLNPLMAWLSNAFVLRAAIGLAHASPYIVFMFIGVAFHYLHRGLIGARLAAALVSALFLGSVIVLQTGMFSAETSSWWSYGLAVAVFSVGYARPNFLKSRRISDFFADISYPLYAIHGVAGYAMLHFLLANNWPAWLSLVVVTSAAVGLAWLLHTVVEVPSHNIGRALVNPRSPILVEGDNEKGRAA